MTRRVDLNAARAARAEVSGGPIEVELGDAVFEIPAEMPLEFAAVMAEGRFREAVALLVGADRADEFLGAGLSDRDLEALLDGAYGIDVGESGASADS